MEVRSSSRASRNLRDVDWVMKISDEFRNIMAHNYIQGSEKPERMLTNIPWQQITELEEYHTCGTVSKRKK